jgi:hypothetical protein
MTIKANYMGRISAGNNLTIDMESNRWRLMTNGDGSERVLVEASSGQPLRYMPTFGVRRRLPDTGALPTQYIQRVVLGWSLKDEAWHLGLLLEPELAEVRGSRWCEVAHWPDPERDLYADIASQAGVKLAEAVTRPFDLIPPRLQDITPSAPAAMPALPVTIDLWTLSRLNDTQLEFKRSPLWSRSKVLRVLWYTFWAAIYVLLSVKTLQGVIALPKPEFLPYLGLASAVVLIFLVLHLLYQLFSEPNRIVVDSAARTVSGLRGNGKRWRVTADQMKAIYVSQVVSRKPKRDKRTIHYGELNLYLKDGGFRFLLDNGQVEEKLASFDETPAEEQVMPLTPDLTASSIQVAAAHMGRALDVPVLYDQRLK